MYNWKWKQGYQILWYNPNNYKCNLARKIPKSAVYPTFTQWWANIDHMAWLTGYVDGINLNVDKYINNFTTSVPENATLYFHKSSKFPRTKLNNSNIKRTIKLDKADYIVLKEPAVITDISNSYYIFTDGVNIFGITDSDFSTYFQYNWKYLYWDQFLGLTFKGPLEILYSGPLKIINDPADTLKWFNDNNIDKPFILDTDLDKIVNNSLPDPDLNSLNAIYDMLNSSDPSTIRLGALMASSFNFTKWPLSFKVLLYQNIEWVKSYNGGNATAIKQMRNSLNIWRSYGGWSILASEIQAAKEEYSEEDVKLAKEFAKGKPWLEDFCKRCQNFYIDSLPFIPDEYKDKFNSN